MKHRAPLFNVFISGLIIISSIFLYIPCTPVMAADSFYPDLGKITGEIPDFPVPFMNVWGMGERADGSSYIRLHYQNENSASGDPSFNLEITYYPELAELTNWDRFNLDSEQSYHLRASWQHDDPILVQEDYRLIESVNSDDQVSKIFYVPSYNVFPWRGFRAVLYQNHYAIRINGVVKNWTGESEFLDLFDKLEQYAKTSIDGLHGGLFFRYYDPITTPSGGEFLGGDLVATLADENGRGISGKDIFFFKGNFSYDEYSFNKFFRFPESDMLHYQMSSNSLILSPDYYVDTTDAYGSKKLGEVRWNYIQGSTIDYLGLNNFLGAHDHNNINTSLYAVVFDKDPRKDYAQNDLPEIEYIEKIDITISGIAAIVSRGRRDESNTSSIRVGEDRQEIGNNLPYYLTSNAIYFDTNSIFTIKWLNGLELTFKIKNGFQDDGEQEIFISYEDAGNYILFNQALGDTLVRFVIGSAPTAIGMVVGGAAGATIGGPISLGIAAVIFLYDKIQENWDPIVVEPRSRILFDFDEDISVYTIEGSALIYNGDSDKPIEIRQNNMVSISAPRECGEVTGFNGSDLPDDLHFIREWIQDNPALVQENDSGDNAYYQPAVTNEISSIDVNETSESNTITYIKYAGIVVGIMLVSATMIVLSQRRKRTKNAALVAGQSELEQSTQAKQRELPSAFKRPGIKCEICGSQLKAGTVFCSNCGAKLNSSQSQIQKRNFCTQCGTSNSRHAKFCRNCGTKIET